jgi:excisionase family DNA binding protein
MKITEPQTDEVLDYRGLSKYMKVAYGTLRHWVMEGKIPYFKIGRNVRFSKKAIDEWLVKYHREAENPVADNTGGLPFDDGGSL